MIRINLLAGPKPKTKGGRGGGPSIGGGGGGPSPLVLVLVVLALTLGGNYGWYWFLQNDAQKLATEKAAAEKKKAELSEVKRAYEAMEKKRDQYQRRIDVIDQLRAAQTGPVDLLNMIGDTVNATDAVWLTVMKDEGSRISLAGSALSVQAVANLIGNLKKTGYFDSVEIKESYQDDKVKDMASFVFELSCEKKKRT